MDRPQLIKLLHHVDGHLGQAIYRTPHATWCEESKGYINQLREAIQWLEELEAQRASFMQSLADQVGMKTQRADGA